MPQIAYWLQKLGLGQYAQRFAENDITFDILPDQSDQDFEKIGVASLCHRRQLLRAIAELKGAPQLSPVTAAPVPPRDVAERRQVTSYVLGPRRLDGSIHTHRPRGFADQRYRDQLVGPIAILTGDREFLLAL